MSLCQSNAIFVIFYDKLRDIYWCGNPCLVFQLRAIDKRRMKNKIGKIKQAKLELLKQSLKEILGLKQ